MSAASAPYNPFRKDSDLVWYPVGASTKIYAGTMVCTRTDGYAYPARSGTSTDVFLGVAYETVDNSSGAAGALPIRVQKEGTYLYGTTGAAQSNVGKSLYASDDNDVTLTSTNNQLIGTCVEFISATQVRVRIDNAVN